MKKILLIISILFLTGCYDYIEINDVSFVSAIAIDYENDEYKLTYEILDDTKTGENTQSKSYFIEASGQTLAKAFDNISLKITKIPYYFHLKVLIIDENIANNLYDLTDFIARNKDIRNEFFLVIAKDVSANTLIKNRKDENEIMGDKISLLIKTNEDDYNISYNYSFEDVLEKLLNKKEDAMVTYCQCENNEIKIGGIATFKDFKIASYIDEKNSGILNLLLNKSNTILLTKSYNEKPLSIKVYNSDVSYTFTSKKVIISINAEGEILENSSNLKLYNKKEYQKLNNDFSKYLKNEVTDFINYLKDKNIDPLGINDRYYKKTKNDITNIYENFEIEIKSNIKINKKGLIFEV